MKNRRQLVAVLHFYAIDPGLRWEPTPRACLGLFAAAKSLGFGFVHGVPPHVYLESLDTGALRRRVFLRNARNTRPMSMCGFRSQGRQSFVALCNAKMCRLPISFKFGSM
jgi:hypothetical protein